MRNSTQKHFVNGTEFETRRAVENFAASNGTSIIKTEVKSRITNTSTTGTVVIEDFHYTLSTVIHLQLTIGPGGILGTFQVKDQNYEPYYPHGIGNSIQEALDDYLQEAEYFYCQRFGYGSFTWKWK